MGDLIVSSDTVLDVPSDGVFHFSSIIISSRFARLTFNANQLNTPIYLLSQGDIFIEGSIIVSASNPSSPAAGRGGPGGFDGGFGGSIVGDFLGGDGQGPGGGEAGGAEFGVFGNPYQGNGKVYGNSLLVPIVGGSGGAGSNGSSGSGSAGSGGGGGGGAIVIASNTRIEFDDFAGDVIARGSGNGSGGAVRLVAPLVEGLGYVDIQGGAGDNAGRFRVDTLDRISWRELTIYGAGSSNVSWGSQMYVFPEVQPRLDILEAAGQTIPEGAGNAISIELPSDAPTSQNIVVQARDFEGLVPIQVIVTPEYGPKSVYDAQLDMNNGNPTQVTVAVDIPAGSYNQIHVWTKPPDPVDASVASPVSQPAADEVPPGQTPPSSDDGDQ